MRNLPWQPHIINFSSLKNCKLVPKIVICQRNQNHMLKRFKKGIIVPKVTILSSSQPAVYHNPLSKTIIHMAIYHNQHCHITNCIAMLVIHIVIYLNPRGYCTFIIHHNPWIYTILVIHIVTALPYK